MSFLLVFFVLVEYRKYELESDILNSSLESTYVNCVTLANSLLSSMWFDFLVYQMVFKIFLLYKTVLGLNKIIFVNESNYADSISVYECDSVPTLLKLWITSGVTWLNVRVMKKVDNS